MPTRLLTRALPALVAIAAVAAPAAAMENDIAYTAGLHLGSPLIASAAGGLIYGSTGGDGAKGLLLMGEPGIGGGKLGFGWASLSGSNHGPYLREGATDLVGSDKFIYPTGGWSLRGVLMRTWGAPLVTENARSYLGIEGEWIFSLGEGSNWGGLYGLNATVGLLRRIDSARHDTDPGNDNLLSLGLGIGF